MEQRICVAILERHLVKNCRTNLLNLVRDRILHCALLLQQVDAYENRSDMSDGWLSDGDTNTSAAWLARQQQKLFNRKEGKPWQVGPEQVCVPAMSDVPCFG